MQMKHFRFSPRRRRFRIIDLELDTLPVVGIILVIIRLRTPLIKVISSKDNKLMVLEATKIWVTQQTIDEAGDSIRIYPDKKIISIDHTIHLDVSKPRFSNGMIIKPARVWMTRTKFVDYAAIVRKQSF